MTVLANYPYLTASAVLCLIAAVVVALARRQRKLLLLSGALALPTALFSWQFIPEYWNPRVLFHHVTTLEDLLFSASMGVIATALALAPFRHEVVLRLQPRTLLRRSLICSLLVSGGHLLLLRTVFEPDQVMVSALTVVSLFVVWLATWRPDTIPVVASGLLSVPLFHFAVLKLYFAFYPETVRDWTSTAQLPFELAGTPALELLWAIAFGASWPALIWYACDAERRRPAQSDFEQTPVTPGPGVET